MLIRISTSPWITLDQGRISEFARCTGDSQRIHVDPELPDRESFGGAFRKLHGLLMVHLAIREKLVGALGKTLARTLTWVLPAMLHN